MYFVCLQIATSLSTRQGKTVYIPTLIHLVVFADQFQPCWFLDCGYFLKAKVTIFK